MYEEIITSSKFVSAMDTNSLIHINQYQLVDCIFINPRFNTKPVSKKFCDLGLPVEHQNQ